jgi:integrase
MSNMIELHNSDFALALNDQDRVIKNLKYLHDKVWDTMAPNTKRAYLSDFNQYLAYCRENGLSSLSSDWRVTQVSIETFFDAYMDMTYKQHNAKDKRDVSTYKHHSIKRKLASIRFFIGVAELPDPAKHSKLHRVYLNNQLNKKPSAQEQASPMRVEEVEKISRLYDNDTLLGKRNLALINVGIDTLFRVSNLVSVELKHIDWKKGTLYLPYSKTDKTGQGHYGYLSKTTLRLLQELVEISAINDGFIFRAFSPNMTIQSRHISTRTAWAIYKKLGALLDDGQDYSCHSTRTGAVISMMENKVPILEIIEAGDWKSSAMPARYGKQMNAATGGMAKVR